MPRRHGSQSDLNALGTIRAQITRPSKIAFVLSLANGRPMLSGTDTAADGIINMAGADNAFDDFEATNSSTTKPSSPPSPMPSW